MILVNDSLVERKDFGVDIEDRAYQFGDGVYEVIRVYGGKAFLPGRHFERLWRSCAELRIPLPFGKNDLDARLVELVQVNRLSGDGVIYLQVSRGAAPRAHQFPAEPGPLLVAYTREVRRPLETMEKGGRAITAEDISLAQVRYKKPQPAGQCAGQAGGRGKRSHGGGIAPWGHCDRRQFLQLFYSKRESSLHSPA